ncbi:uncharacterized protein G2W53_040074 [Senna tora]|uniref:Uncharacterized protein n=1 Tax=Senna tora TaxID=362788 RepID=A0A834SRL4_9FABA|nr:uncharacterized protein G2W53_040074 [Senna tora]
MTFHSSLAIQLKHVVGMSKPGFLLSQTFPSHENSSGCNKEVWTRCYDEGGFAHNIQVTISFDVLENEHGILKSLVFCDLV